MQGSQVSKEVVNSYSNKDKRDEILEEKAQEESTYFILKEDIPFDSLSEAASFCLGSQVNGWDYWKDKSGKAINEILSRENN